MWRPSAQICRAQWTPKGPGTRRTQGPEHPGTKTHCVADRSPGQHAGFKGTTNQENSIQQSFVFFVLVVEALLVQQLACWKTLHKAFSRVIVSGTQRPLS